ncbi:DUF2520 domain-containing protein [Lutibacter sp.]|uniref:Rossmann-like and DUF2520 domain-containing protein n=1 Tax=Lutibacter sp. TaxID=1925666 RepID=UPI001A1D11B3|nr:DUF2520 domain-containing protein [Lutibacter sp.]MBI9041406.1 DUF2520 domain-containing protein [Lutibacter sp.]
MVKVVLLGAGNLGYHLTQKMLNSTSIKLVQVYNRSITKIEYLKDKVSITNNINGIIPADIYILCVSDNAISEISSHLNFPTKLVVHTSGATSINDLKSNSTKGVIYFPQTFSKEKNVNFTNIPICIEASTSHDLEILKNFSKEISNNVYLINSEQRKVVHLAAVFVNNFVNHLYFNAEQICTKNNVPFEILHPIILETVQKINKISPFDAQTGPAKRQDTKTLNTHKAMLTSTQLDIYTLLTKSIKETYDEKL